MATTNQSQKQTFLDNFNANIQKLSNINAIIEQNIQNKKKFSDLVFSKLEEINLKVNELGGKITNLKNIIDQLKGKVDANTTDINDKETQVNTMRRHLQDLLVKNEELEKQIVALQQKCASDIQKKQQQISALNTEIQRLNATNKSLQDEANRFQIELESKGNLGVESAKQLESQKQEFLKQIQTLTQQNEQKIQEYQQEIVAIQNEIIQLKQQLQKAQKDIQDRDNTIQSLRDQNATSTVALQKEVDRLKAENEDFLKRIVSANVAIAKALQVLDRLTTEGANDDNVQNLNRVVQQVEQTLQQISNSIQGYSRGGKRSKKSKKSRQSRKCKSSKKNKKYFKKGGFHYKLTSKRRTLTTISNFKKSKRTT